MLTDLEVARRSQALTFASLRDYGRTFERLNPGDGPGVLEVAGGLAVFAGEQNPLTQVDGVGLGQAIEESDLDKLEDFYRGRATNWELVVDPLSPQELLILASKKGYVLDHFETQMYREPTSIDMPVIPGLEMTEVEAVNPIFMGLCMAGWLHKPEMPDEVDPITHFLAASEMPRRYIAWIDGEPAGAASMTEFEGCVALFGGTTRTQFRKRGIQQALLAQRLRDASPNALGLMSANAGTDSLRNARRIGFQVLFSSLVLMRNP